MTFYVLSGPYPDKVIPSNTHLGTENRIRVLNIVEIIPSSWLVVKEGGPLQRRNGS